MQNTMQMRMQNLQNNNNTIAYPCASPSRVRAEASLLPHDAHYIARTCTLIHRTRVAALSMPQFSVCDWHAYKCRASEFLFPRLAKLQLVDWREGQIKVGRREGAPGGKTGREKSRQRTLPAGMSGRAVRWCATECEGRRACWRGERTDES